MPTVRVAIRARPEQTESVLKDFKLGATGSIHLTAGGQKHEFAFDHIFPSDATQEEVFNVCAVPICNGVLEGFNGSIFAYGQTGAGKTHTMSGPSEKDDYDYDRDRGLCMRVASYLFELSRRLTDTVSIRLSILEIYNEQLIDLLREPQPVGPSFPLGPTAPKLNIVETPTQGVIVPALYVLPLSSEEDAFSFFLTAHKNRVVGEHQLNRQSSRSHVIYTFYVDRVRMRAGAQSKKQQQQHQDNGIADRRKASQSKTSSQGSSTSSSSGGADESEVSQSRVHLVDLAGSERNRKTGSVGFAQKEATYINRSLSYLEQVVVALTQTKRDHIPYRQSKLTHLLKDSLGGSCLTTMVACVWPHISHDWETLSTLRFSSRMKNIENTPVRNHLTDKEVGSTGLIKQLNALKRELILRDTIAGAEPYMHVLTAAQKSAAVHQATEIVSGGVISADTSADGQLYHDPRRSDSGGGGGEVGYAIPEDMQIHSASQIQFLVGTLRAAIWEACDGDSALVADVMERTKARFRAASDGLAGQKGGEGGGGGVDARFYEPLPRKEEWIYPSGDNDADVDNFDGSADDTAVTGMNQHFPAFKGAESRSNNSASGSSLPALQLPKIDKSGAGNQSQNASSSRQSLLSSVSVRSGIGPAQAVRRDGVASHGSNAYEEGELDNETIDSLRDATAGGILPQSMPDPFDDGNEEGKRQQYTPAHISKNFSRDQIRSSTADNTDIPDTDRMGGAAAVHSAPSKSALSFEDFKEGAGAVLYQAYNDIRRALRVEKNNQREITSILNQRKAEIDELQASLSAYTQELRALHESRDEELRAQSDEKREGAGAGAGSEEESSLKGADMRTENDTDMTPRELHFLEQSENITSVIDDVSQRLGRAKDDYRAAHVELQLCKQQIEDTQVLKKRAMNSIVSAYDKASSSSSNRGSRQVL
jgi:hypothetical protein